MSGCPPFAMFVATWVMMKNIAQTCLVTRILPSNMENGRGQQVIRKAAWTDQNLQIAGALKMSSQADQVKDWLRQ